MKKYFTFLLLAFTYGSLQGQVKQTAPPEPVYETAIDSATARISRGDYAGVIGLLKNFPENDTAYVTALDKLSLSYLVEDSTDRAIETARAGLALRSPYKRHFYEILGAAYDQNKEYDKASETFSKGVTEFPQYTRFWYHMGVSSIVAKKYEDAEKYLRKSIQLNPFYASAHLQLGQIMYHSNRMIPAMLSYHIFLMLDGATPKSLTVLQEYEKMGNGEYKSDPDSLWLKIPASVDNFQELNAIVNSKFALNEKYKSNVKLKYTTIVKTMQIIGEKLEYNKADTGFYMQFYVPFFMEMIKANEFETSIYYSLRVVDDDAVAKEVKKQGGNIDKMAKHLNDYLTKYRQDQWKAQNLSKYDTWFNNSGQLASEGNYIEKTNSYSGDYRYYWPGTSLKSKGTFTPSGKSTGKWQYYYPEGELQAVKFYKEDMLTDSSIFYYPGGAVSDVIFYKDDKYNGGTRTFFETGGINTSVTYVNGVRTGPVVYYYQNRYKKLETTLLNDKVNGHYVAYYDNGKKQEEADYVNGLAVGPEKNWYANGRLKSEGNYKNGEKDGEWKTYNQEGYMESSGIYKAGKMEGLWKTLNRDGTVFSEIKYAGGNIDGDANFYEDGKLWSILTFAKGQLKKYKYFDTANKVLSEGAEKGGVLKLNSFYNDGDKFKERTYIDGKTEGKCTTWNRFGKLQSVENFKNDELDGKQTYYSDAGTLQSESTYSDGKADGLSVDYYKNGVISEQGWYKDDVKRGEWYAYNAAGTISEISYYQNGDKEGFTRYYDVTGKLENLTEFSYGDVASYADYDTLGKPLNHEVVVNGSASFNSLHLNKKVKIGLVYKHGLLDSEIKRLYSNGKVRSITKYANGNANGSYKNYSWDGKLIEDGFYKDGYRDSTRILYENEKMYIRANYFRGELNGERLWYHPNGQVSTKGSFINGNQEGYFYYLADNGMLRYRLLYKYGNVLSYSYLNADSTFKPEIPLNNSTGEIKAFYLNGKPSATLTYNCGYFDGPYIQYYPDGKVKRECKYVLHELEGVNKEYNSAGQLEAEENYTYDTFDGLSKYYINGVLQRESAYIMDSYHGTTKIYDKAGKLIKTVKMYNDEPFE